MELHGLLWILLCLSSSMRVLSRLSLDVAWCRIPPLPPPSSLNCALLLQHLCSDLVRRRVRTHSLVPCSSNNNSNSNVVATLTILSDSFMRSSWIFRLHAADNDDNNDDACGIRSWQHWDGDWRRRSRRINGEWGLGNDSPVGINDDDIIVSLKSEVSDVSWALCTSSYPTMYLSFFQCGLAESHGKLLKACKRQSTSIVSCFLKNIYILPHFGSHFVSSCPNKSKTLVSRLNFQ